MNKKILFLLFYITVLCSQHLIQTKEYSFYKSNDVKAINFTDIVGSLKGDYIIEVVSINDLQFNQTKNVFIQNCELKFHLQSNISKDDIEISRCKDEYFYENVIRINQNNPELTINYDKYNHLSCTFTFWITGKFEENVKNSQINKTYNGVLREWYDSGDLYIQYNYKGGKKHGIQNRWYKNNTLDIEYYFKEGKLDGEQKRWYSNGQIKSIGHYSSDKLNGIFKEWHENGQLKEIRLYEHDILVEIIESYDKHGMSN